MSRQNRERLHSIEERLDRLEAHVAPQPAPADGALDRIERQLARIERYITGTDTPLDRAEASIDGMQRQGELDDTMADIKRERRDTLARLTAAANKITDLAYRDPDDGRSQALLTCTDDLHTCAVTSSAEGPARQISVGAEPFAGAVKCWGANRSNQLGDGMGGTSRGAPADVIIPLPIP